MANRYVTFGEIMLRLRSTEHYRLFQTPILEATFGGGEANVAVSLALLGEDVSFITAIPKNAIGEAALMELRKYGVDISKIKMVPDSRLGIYFLETGANQRPSLVVYDRANSAIAEASPELLDFDTSLKDVTWFHITGITPALSQKAADSALLAVKKAKDKGATVSIDLNYRKKLWNYGRTAPEVMCEIVKYADVVIANEEDIQKCLGIEATSDVTSGKLEIDVYKTLAENVKESFPNIKVVAITLRESKGADHNGWSAVLHGQTGFYHSRHYEITDIVDRVGGGDSFAAGLIYALSHFDDEEKSINFAVAASALKHSVSGDFNLSRLSEIEALLKGDGSGRVLR